MTYDYGCLGRVIRITGSGGERKEYAYDAVGNVTKVTDVYGHATCYEYSLTGQLTKVTDALGNTDGIPDGGSGRPVLCPGEEV